MSLVWTIAEQHNGDLKDVSFELLTRGRALADTLQTGLAAVVIGDGVRPEALQELIARGADDIYSVQHPGLADFICENYAAALTEAIALYKPPIILAAATTTGRTLMPYLAIKVGAGLTADCTELTIEPGTDNLLQTRPAIGGNIMATIKTPHHRPQIATVRPRSARPLPPDPGRAGRIIDVPFNPDHLDSRIATRGYRRDETDFVNLEDAEIVVAGGRGVKKGENFQLLRDLANDLANDPANDLAGGMGAGPPTSHAVTLGASRDAVDRGWIGYSHQIGLSGKTISPRLYIAAGISGSVQHLAGIKTAETIVSINIDPDAPIHRVADFAVVGDLFTVIPELRRRLALLKDPAPRTHGHDSTHGHSPTHRQSATSPSTEGQHI